MHTVTAESLSLMWVSTYMLLVESINEERKLKPHVYLRSSETLLKLVSVLIWGLESHFPYTELQASRKGS